MSFGTINKSMTVADAVKVNPELMDVLAKDGIDFCCGGGHPLVEAIEAKGKDVDEYRLSVKCWGIHPTSLLWHQS